jgi:dienelactone hydrolase
MAGNGEASTGTTSSGAYCTEIMVSFQENRGRILLRNRILILIIFMITGGLLSCFLFGDISGKYEIQTIFYQNSLDEPVFATLYLPPLNLTYPAEGKECINRKKLPALISVHSGFQNSESLQPAFSSMVRNNIIVMEILLGGRKANGNRKSFEDYIVDVSSGINVLVQHPSVDKDRIFLSGHSVGANIASIIGSTSNKVTGVIATGYPVEFSPDSPVKLLMTAGVLDQLHEPAKMKKSFAQTYNDKSQAFMASSPFETGKFTFQNKEGTRIYFQSFLSDHYTEPVDPDITAAVINFVRSGDKAETPDYIPFTFNSVNFNLKIISRIFFYLSLVFLFVYLFIFIKTSKYFEQKLPGILHTRVFSIIFLLAYFIAGGICKLDEVFLSVYIVSALLVSVIVYNFFILKMKMRNTEKAFDAKSLSELFLKDTKKILVIGGVIYISFLTGLYFHAGLSVYSDFSAALRTLTGVFHLITGHIFLIITRINSFYLSNDRTFNLFSPVVLTVISAELIYPGGIGRIFDEVLTLLIKHIREVDFSIKWKFNWPGLILLIILIISGVSVWKGILAEGYEIGINEMTGFGYLFLCYIIIPMISFTALARWKLIHNLISRLSFQGEPDI